jgi:phage terminase small subunit
MQNYKTVEPPEHLSNAAKDWWRSVVQDFALEPSHLKLLTLAAQAWDRAEDARIHLVLYGTIYVDRWGQPKSRPEVAIERDSRIAFARLLRELRLEGGAPDAPRPPSLKG